MSLPKGWIATSVGEIASVNPREFTSPVDDDDTVSFLPMPAIEETSGHLDLSQTRKWAEVRKGFTRFEEGDVLFAKITPSMENGKITVAQGLTGGRGAGTTELHVFRPTSGIQPGYLRYFLLQESVRRYARVRMTGTAGQLRVPASAMEGLTIPLPPLPEQRRIVEAIETRFTRLDAAVKALQRVRANLKRYRASVWKAASGGYFSSRVDRWPCVGIFDVADDLDGDRIPVNATDREHRKGNVPYYGATGQVGWIDKPIFNEELVLLGEDGVDFLDRLKPKAYTIRGPAWVNNHAHVLRAKPGKMLTKFLEVQLNAANYFGLANGTTRLKLTKSAMKRIPIRAPPVAEQEKIIEEIDCRLSIVGKVARSAEGGIARCARARASVLQQAFEGRLVVQEPQDEPASALLERIKRERSQQAPNGPSGRRGRRRTDNRGDS